MFFHQPNGIRSYLLLFVPLMTHAFSLEQVWYSLTFHDWGATTSTFMRPSRLVWNRMLWLPPLTSCMMPGEVDWTGATLAGSAMALCNTPSPSRESPAEARTQCPVSGTTGFGIKLKADMMCSVLHPTSMVGY